MSTHPLSSEPKILVVDDEQSLVNLCLLILEQAGYKVRGAFSGKQALQMVGDEMPDLILLDVMMPGMTGIEVCRRIRELRPEQRPYILMYTADDRQLTKTESLSAGATDFISKDTPIFDLPNKIQSYLTPTA
ncbi:response regulator [Candidatus Leptofilum sp.]|uniref:response regulator n=1 Tax=Candidatus Leptofilum sp. TaxID=3241576 RepID=UPI003B599AA4